MTLVDARSDILVERLADALNRRVGLRPGDVARKIAAGLAKLQCGQRLAYAERLIAAAPQDREWLEFVEPMLVHETYFFRHPAQLELLRDTVLPSLEARRRQSGRRLLVAWNAGCSTGEEAWTMALLAAAPDRREGGGTRLPMSVLATDLSEASLAVARAGVYQHLSGLDSFRAIPPWATRHFAGTGRGAAWSVPAGPRGDVRFLRHNLLDPPPVAEADLVVCRNTLIYFEEAANRRAQAHLASALRPGGVLVLGPADALRLPDAFEPIETYSATVYRKLGS
ncbi:MAG: CheR family methyltransferase [Xanthobacteraceae bacterium]